MASGPEILTSRTLRTILDVLPNGATIDDSEEFRHALTDLHWFVSEVLAEIYPKWRGQSLDGIYPHFARKTGEQEVELFGLCTLISDQGLMPIHLRLQLALTSEEVSWLELRLGEKGRHGMVRMPYREGAIYKQLHALNGREETIEWVYKVTFGQRRT